MIIRFSKNPIKQFTGIVYWNRYNILLFGLFAGLAYTAIIIYEFDYIRLPAIPVSILGGALSIFLGFRNSSAYDRWWEARKIWGAVVNDSRSFGLELITYPIGKDNEEETEIEAWRLKAVRRHIGWLNALDAHLRKKDIDLTPYLSSHEIELISGKKNIPVQIQVLQGNEMDKAFRKGWVEEFRFNSLIGTIKKFYDDQGKAERIKNTVFPFYYNYFTSLILWLFALSLPFALATIMNTWIMIPVSILISFSFFILNKAGILTETPFESTAADTPLSTICRTIEIDMLEMLDSDEVPESLPITKGKFGVLSQS